MHPEHKPLGRSFFFGEEFDGAVIVSSSLLCQDLFTLGTCRFHLYEGHFMLVGERRKSLIPSSARLRDEIFSVRPFPNGGILSPQNLMPALQLVIKAESAKQDIRMHFLLDQDGRYYSISPGMIAENLRKIKISMPLRQVDGAGDWFVGFGSLLPPRPTQEPDMFQVFPVDQNHLGQWAVCESATEPLIMQVDTYLKYDLTD